MQGFDLLKIKIFRKLFLSNWILYSIQAVLLLIFIGLAIFGWQVYPLENYDDKLFAKSHLVTQMIWAIWWPSMIWIAIFFGRIWCSVCPLELLSNLIERVTRKLGMRQKNLSKRGRMGVYIVLLYAFTQLLIAGIHIHRIPAYTSFFLIGLITVAIFSSIVYKDRAFCRGFCPVGLLLNVYGRGSTLGIRSSDNKICSSCSSKDCSNFQNRYLIDKRSCPSLLNPETLSTNADCLVCGQCVKSCSHNNVQLLARPLFHKNDSRTEKSNWVLTTFIILLFGFVTYELTTEWKAAKSVFLLIPNHLTSIIGIESIGGFIKGIWTIGIFPFLLWTVLGVINKIFNRTDSIFATWQKIVIPAIPMIAAGHLTKGIAKFTSWVGYIPEVIKNPSGHETMNGLSIGIISVPSKLLLGSTIGVVGFILVSLGLYFSIRELGITNGKLSKNLIFPLGFIYLLFLTIIIGIGLK